MKNLNYQNSLQFSSSKGDFLKLIRYFSICFSQLKKISKIWLKSNALFILHRRLIFICAPWYRYTNFISIYSFRLFFVYVYALWDGCTSLTLVYFSLFVFFIHVLFKTVMLAWNWVILLHCHIFYICALWDSCASLPLSCFTPLLNPL